MIPQSLPPGIHSEVSANLSNGTLADTNLDMPTILHHHLLSLAFYKFDDSPDTRVKHLFDLFASFC